MKTTLGSYLVILGTVALFVFFCQTMAHASVWSELTGKGADYSNVVLEVAVCDNVIYPVNAAAKEAIRPALRFTAKKIQLMQDAGLQGKIVKADCKKILADVANTKRLRALKSLAKRGFRK